MSRTQYRGYIIQLKRKADRHFAVRLFPYDQANRDARSRRLAGDIELANTDGSPRYVTSVTEGIEAARLHIDQLRDAA